MDISQPALHRPCSANHRVVYFCDSNRGGIYEYALCQAPALAAAGAGVAFVCRADFPAPTVPDCRVYRCLGPSSPSGSSSRLLRAYRMVADARANAATLGRLCAELDCRHLLMACYREYLAPFWIGPWRKMQRRGITFGTIAHDPIRNFRVGPLWWHRCSVATGYSFINHVFAHDNTPIDNGGRPARFKVTVIPHGPYRSPPPSRSRATTRQALGIPEDTVLFLAFGHVRDGKNLDLFIRAMAAVPRSVGLLVAGTASSSSQRPIAFYQDLARRLGVADCCWWQDRYVSEMEAADFFEACDFCLLTYTRDFVSASGVMNTATTYRKPCLGSSGAGSMAKSIREYQLGVWVEPDSLEALRAGLIALIETPPHPEWERYDFENSWQRNAELVLDAIFETK